MNFSGYLIQTESLGDFLKKLGKKGLKVSKKMAKKVLRIPRTTLKTGTNVGSAFATKSPEAALSSLPESIHFYHTGRNIYLGKFE